MRVTIIVKRFSPGDVFGGAEAFAWRITGHLVARGVHVDILSARIRRGWKPVEWLQAGERFVRVRRLAHPASRVLGTAIYVAGLVVTLIRTRKDYDAVFVTFAGLDAVAARVASLVTRRPVLCKVAASSNRGDLGQIRGSWHARWTFRLLRGVDRFVALNSEVAGELHAIGVSGNQIVSLPNGIDVDCFSPLALQKRPRVRRELGLPQRGLLFVGVGRQSLQKNWNTLLHALASLDVNSDWHCVLLGKGAERDTLLALTRQLGLEERVTFKEAHDVRPYLRAADIFVLPSLWEGLSNALLEAQACGLPAVCSDIPGNRAVIAYGENGYLFPCGDAGALARRLRLLIGNAETRAHMGAVARRRTVDAFSITGIAARYVEIISGLTGLPIPRSSGSTPTPAAANSPSASEEPSCAR